MSKYPMPDVVVLLPGITGSVLRKRDKVVWGYSAKTVARALFTRGDSMERDLALPHDDPAVDALDDGIVADALMPDLHLLPGVWKIDGYGKVAAAIEAGFTVAEGRNFFRFPYDWRRDNRVAARRLARAAHGWLKAWRESSGNPGARLILVAHSMGGLVSRYFLECLEGWKLTRALVSFGTPYRGSLNALDGLANGLKKGPLDLSSLARQLTALYQLLPVFECYDGGDGALVRVGETTGIPNVDPAKAAAALAFHREIEAAVAANQRLPEYHTAGYRIYPVVGIAQQTSLSARLAGDRVDLLDTWKGRALGGDGTVPRVSAVPLELSDAPTGAMYAATQHGSLQNADAVIMHLTGVLSGIDLGLGEFRRPRAQVALEVADVYLADEPLRVRARPSREGIALRATLWRSGEARPVASAPMTADGGDWLAAEFATPAAGAYRVTVGGDEVETAEDALVVAGLGRERGAAFSHAVALGADRMLVGDPSELLDLDLGPMRGGGARAAAGDAAGETEASSSAAAATVPAEEIEITLSAETKTEIDLGSRARVDFQIELSEEALPLAVAQSARARKDLPIVVSLSAENDALEILRSHEFVEEPPGPGKPRNGFFTVKAVRAGACRLAVSFRQGGSELGVIGLAVAVIAAGAGDASATGHVRAAPRDPADDDKLALLVEQRSEGGQVFYEYTLHSEALGLPYRRLRSQPLLDRGGGPAASALAFVERIYERVTAELERHDDLKALQREARGLGVKLCEELFHPAVAKVLWPLRDRISLVQIVSWEPYIPWELVRLRDPDSDAIDERFLCEYGLVRTLSDEMPPRALPLARWAYLAADFPLGSFPPVSGDVDFLTGTGADSLRGHGITPTAIAPTRDAFYAALADGDFDVLHISCHAESPHRAIEDAALIIGDEMAPGESRPRLVQVDSLTVEAEARLRQRRPLVFLNACETGRMGAVLTAWGGWPNVFLRRGAGAFVGTSWAVRDGPAAVFSTTFYAALLDGQTLAEAASAARAAAKAKGDASWLAFKVYGHPRAQRAGV